MRVDHVKANKGIGYIKFNNDTEMDLIQESMSRLKQQKLVYQTESNDISELKKLEKFKKSKESVVEIPKQNRAKIKGMRDKMKEKFKKEKEDKIKKAKPDDVIIGDVEDTQEYKDMDKVLQGAEPGSGLGEGIEVTHRDMHVLANALNEHICDMEKDGLYKKTRRNSDKYEKLKQLLENAQEQKALFERSASTSPKPKGFGRLRK